MTKKQIEDRVNNIILKLKKKYLLQDWNIYFHVNMSKQSKNVGLVQMVTRSGLKEAAINIYPKVIKEVQESGLYETLETVLDHECLHLIVHEAFLTMDSKITGSLQFGGCEELLVEKMRLIFDERKTSRRTTK